MSTANGESRRSKNVADMIGHNEAVAGSVGLGRVIKLIGTDKGQAISKTTRKKLRVRLL